MDIGSTTVKALAVDPASLEILWSDYRRHHALQAVTARALLGDRAQAGKQFIGVAQPTVLRPQVLDFSIERCERVELRNLEGEQFTPLDGRGGCACERGV